MITCIRSVNLYMYHFSLLQSHMYHSSATRQPGCNHTCTIGLSHTFTSWYTAEMEKYTFYCSTVSISYCLSQRPHEQMGVENLLLTWKRLLLNLIIELVVLGSHTPYPQGHLLPPRCFTFRSQWGSGGLRFTCSPKLSHT